MLLGWAGPQGCCPHDQPETLDAPGGSPCAPTVWLQVAWRLKGRGESCRGEAGVARAAHPHTVRGPPAAAQRVSTEGAAGAPCGGFVLKLRTRRAWEARGRAHMECCGARQASPPPLAPELYCLRILHPQMHQLQESLIASARQCGRRARARKETVLGMLGGGGMTAHKARSREGWYTARCLPACLPA